MTAFCLSNFDFFGANRVTEKSRVEMKKVKVKNKINSYFEERIAFSAFLLLSAAPIQGSPQGIFS